MRIKTLLSVFCLCGLLTACGGDSAPQKTSSLTGDQLSKEVENFRVTNGLPGLAVVVVDQDKIEVAASGRRRIDASNLIQANDQFQMGSLTKAFSATLIARLVERKKLRWDSSLSEIFPAWRAQMRPEYLGVTVTQLLRHRSGLPRDFADADFQGLQAVLTGAATTDRVAAALWFLQKPPLFAPDSQYDYSNIGYMVVGLIAEAVGGDTYENLLAKEVLTPLQMKGAFGLPEDAGPGTPVGHTIGTASWQIARAPQFMPDPTQFKLWLSAVSAAGGLNVSLPDYGRFLREQLNGLQGRSSYLAQPSFRLMHTPQDGYGFGWTIGDIPGVGTVSGHNGTVGTYYSTNRLIPGQNRAVAVVCNCYSDSAANQIEQFANTLAGLVPKP